MNSSSHYYSLLVIGNNPNDQVLKFDITEDTENPYVIYKYSERNQLRKNKIKIYDALLREESRTTYKKAIADRIDKLSNMSDDEYYFELGEVYSYDVDNNIITSENPNGKWITCERGGHIFSNYIKDFNDNGVISAIKKNIDWTLTHMRQDNVNIYNKTWDLCINSLKPETDYDINIFKNMNPYKDYIKSFNTKEAYTKMSCSFWTYAVIINGVWVDMDDKNEYDWISNFYNNFIIPVSDNDLLTIYEYTK
jgi:hypothetical protein